METPPEGQKQRLVIAIDYGTTYTGMFSTSSAFLQADLAQQGSRSQLLPATKLFWEKLTLF
jgi:hypothetical protein